MDSAWWTVLDLRAIQKIAVGSPIAIFGRYLFPDEAPYHISQT